MKATHAGIADASSRFLLLPVMAAMVWTLVCTGSARGEAVFSLEPAGSGAYAIVGAGLERIAALDFTLVYDTGTARNPRVVKGPFVPADASFFANTAIPGELRVMIIRNREIAGSGTIASVSFERVGTMEPRVVSFTSNPISVTASPLDAAAGVTGTATGGAITGGGGTTTDTAAGSTDGTNGEAARGTVAGTAGSGGSVVALGTVSMPGDRVESEKDRQEKKEAQQAGAVAAEQQPFRQEDDILPEPDAGRVEPAVTRPAPIPKNTVYQSVLERMKAYTGERSAAALMALFNPVAGQEVSQEPPVAVSDGESIVTLRVELPLALKSTPRFAFRNANMVSLGQADDGSWVIGLLPRKNTMEARITVSFDGGEILFPLVVVPPVDPALLVLDGSPEATFSHFLTFPAPGREPRFDLNGDGAYDYVDDYLFTAHYLAARQKPAGQMPVERQPHTTP